MPKPEYLVVDHLSIKEITRIFSKIHVDPITECWLWTGSLYKNGYAVAYLQQEQRNEYGHRLLYAWLVEPLPKGRGKDIPVLDHIVCDTPACVNPAHTKLGPQRNNVLRGKSLSAANARKTHCPNGHELPPFLSTGQCRRCEICRITKYQAEMHGPRRAELLERRKINQRNYMQRKRQAKAQGLTQKNEGVLSPTEIHSPLMTNQGLTE